MALDKLTTNRTNIKRAEALARYGINTMDITSARPQFTGYGSGTCELCGKKHLKWLFQLHFKELGGLEALAKTMCDIDRDGAVTITPVGSKCIIDWIDAVPESLEKIELMKRWDTEMEKCKAAMKAKVVEDLCAAAGFDTVDAAYDRYLDRFGIKAGSTGYLPADTYKQLRNTLTNYEISFMRRNAYKVKDKTLSRKTCQDWLQLLLKLPELRKPQPAPAPAGGIDNLSDADLIDRGDKVFDANKDKLKVYYQTAFMDMGSRVRRDGKFASDRQKKFYTDLLAKLEA